MIYSKGQLFLCEQIVCEIQHYRGDTVYGRLPESQKKTYFIFCSKAYLNLYLLQKTIFGNVALSTGVVFEISVVDTVASWYVLSVLKKKIGVVI